MSSPAETTLARIRRLVPPDWDARLGDEARAAAVLAEVAAELYRPAKARAQIVEYVAAHPGARMTEIRDALGLRGGSVSGNLTPLVQQGRLIRTERGRYRAPPARS